MPARGAAPADRFRYLDGGGTVGVIPTVTKPFCGDCDRVRLTAEGDFRTCLFATTEVTLLDVLRSGGSDDDDRRADRGRRRHEVGGPPDQPGELHPPRQVDEPDRRLSLTPRRAPTPAEPGCQRGVADDVDGTGVAPPEPQQQIARLAADRHVTLGVLPGEVDAVGVERRDEPFAAVSVQWRWTVPPSGPRHRRCRRRWRSTSGTRRCRPRRRADRGRRADRRRGRRPSGAPPSPGPCGA